MLLDVATIVLALGALVFIAHFFDWLFGFIKIPNALLLIIVGLVLGPWLGIVTPASVGEFGEVFVIIALVILAFQDATELKISVLKQAWRGTISLTLLNFAVVTGIVGLFAWGLADLHPLLALAVGAMVGGTASIIVDPIVDRLKMHESSRATLFLESEFGDVLSLVLVVGLITILRQDSLPIGALALGTLSNIALAVGVGILGGLVWSLLLKRVHQMRNSIFTTPAFVFILYGFMEQIGVSGLMTALVFGLTLGNIDWLKAKLGQGEAATGTFALQPLSDVERSLFAELVFTLQTFFFIFVGISITFASLWVVALGLILTLVIFVVRHPIVQIALPRRTPIFDASLMAAIVPKGLVAAVLAAIPMQAGLPGAQFIQDLVYPIIFFSVLITSLAIFLFQKTELGALHRRMFGGFGYYTEPPEIENPKSEYRNPKQYQNSNAQNQ